MAAHILIFFVSIQFLVPKEVKPQYEDNIKWIKKAQENDLVRTQKKTCCTIFGQSNHLMFFNTQVVGSQARILYSNQNGRVSIALAFNEAIASKKIKVREK